MKGEERVCHVTEADRFGAAKAVRLSGEVSSCEAAVFVGPRFCEGLRPADAGLGSCPCARRFCAAELMG